MRDWLGKAWDFLIQGVGGLIVKQRWTDYKRWTDFGGSWLFKAEYRWVVVNEEIRNPNYKFFWWWLRQAVFIVGKVVGRIKAFGVVGVKGNYKLNISEIIRSLGFCMMQGIYRLKSAGNIKVQSNFCISQYISWQHFGTWQDWANATNGKWYYRC